MTELTEKYEGSIAAGRALEGGVWALALALAKDVQKNGGTAREATEALAQAGVTSSSGSPYKPDWIGNLVKIGTFVLGHESDFCHYPVKRVLAAGVKHDWDAEAMLLTLQANGTSHQIAGSSPLGKATAYEIAWEVDKLSAPDKAAIATELISKPEVRDAILQSGQMAVEQHIELAGEIYHAVKDNTERTMKEQHPSHAARTAADEIGTAARHLSNAHQEIVRWNVTEQDDRFRLVESAMARVERAVSEINDSLGRVTA